MLLMKAAAKCGFCWARPMRIGEMVVLGSLCCFFQRLSGSRRSWRTWRDVGFLRTAEKRISDSHMIIDWKGQVLKSGQVKTVEEYVPLALIFRMSIRRMLRPQLLFYFLLLDAKKP